MAVCLAALLGPIGRSAQGQPATTAVEIVRNEGPTWNGADAWVVQEQPTLQIGAAHGDERYLFYRVRSVVRLADGRVVVANAGSHELRSYDTSGRWLASAGRRGAGPGEFGAIAWINLLRGDTILAWDPENVRLSWFGPSLTFVRSVRLQATAAQPSLLGAWHDGSALGAHLVYRDPGNNAVVRDSLLYVRYGPDGQPRDLVGRFPRQQFFRVTQEQEGGRVGVTTVALPFGPIPCVAVGLDGFVWGAGDSYRLTVFSREGAPRLIVHWTRPDRPVTDRIARRYREEIVSGIPNPTARRVQRRVLERVPFPETMPAYSLLIVDDDGNIWVRDYIAPGDPPPRWNVFSRSGVLLGEVEMPPGMRPTHIGTATVAGVWTDDATGVQFVRVHALRKGRR